MTAGIDVAPINCEELLHEPYILEPILKPRFSVESTSLGPLQVKPSHAEPSQAELSTSEAVEVINGSKRLSRIFRSYNEKLSEAVEVIIDEASNGQLPHDPIRKVVVLQAGVWGRGAYRRTAGV